MRLKICLAIMLGLFLCYNGLAQHADSTNSSSTLQIIDTAQSNYLQHQEIDQVDDISPGMFFIILLAFVLMLASIVLVIGISLLVIVILVGLVSIGVISTSVIVGLYKKSFAKGFKTFLIISSVVGFIAITTLGLYFWNYKMHWWTEQTALIIGILLGIITGTICGYCLHYVILQIFRFLKDKLNLS